MASGPETPQREILPGTANPSAARVVEKPMSTTEAAQTHPARVATERMILMCRPDFFTVDYRINPWMNPEQFTDTALAVSQWEVLYDTYRSLGFAVHLIDPVGGLPDMVYAANGGFVIDNVAYGAKFRFEERVPEG